MPAPDDRPFAPYDPAVDDRRDSAEGERWEPCYEPDNVVPLPPVADHRQGDVQPQRAPAPMPGKKPSGVIIPGASSASIVARPFQYRKPSDVPPRAWLYGHHLIRQYASATIAPGGVGKSTLSIAEALAMVTGKPLLGVRPHTRLRVWMWNGEDPREELERRIIAAMEFHGIDPGEVEGRLFVNSGRDMPMKIGISTPNGPTVVKPVVDGLVAAISRLGIDVLQVDPFVSAHSVPENDNGAMDGVVKAFAQIADRTGCAIDLYHHSRKLNGADADIDAVRGGSAIAGAVRSARALNVMSPEAAKGLGVPADERRSFVRIDDAKANLAPADAARWFRLANQNLGNQTATRPEDRVAVAASWTPPDAFEGLTLDDLDRVQRAVYHQCLRKDAQANAWVGHRIGPIIGLNSHDDADKAKLKKIIAAWVASGALRVDTIEDERGNPRPVIEVGEWAKGGPPEPASPP